MAEAAARSGATALGVVLASSRRQVTVESIRDIGDHLDRMGLHTPLVGVVVNENAVALNDLTERSGIDMVQLSGDESPDLPCDLSVPVVKAIRLLPGQTVEEGRRAIEPWLDHRHPVDAILLDAYADGHYGGTGLRADWALAAELAERYPLILAGGLTSQNVGDAIRQVRPFGVDVSSGVETDGVKDGLKIQAFISAFQEAVGAPETFRAASVEKERG